MGQLKSGLELGGRTFFERVAAACAPVFEETVVVTKQGRGDFPLRTIHEANEDVAAPIIGLDRALEDAGGTPCWVLAVDYPLISSELLAWLRTRFEGVEADMVVPWVGSKMHVLCAGYRPIIAASVKERIARGELQLKGLVGVHTALIVGEREILSRFKPFELTNVNTPADYDEIRRIHGEAQGA
jgi:molybdopterin-guanine dinucleotide biosynthesis protein A